ncbi:MAG: alpha/beta fold hydrolase [Xanthobacteraceae bacterium]
MSSRQHLQGCDRKAAGEPDMPGAPAPSPRLPAAFLWPLSAAASASQATASFLDLMVTTLTGRTSEPHPPEWATPNTVRLDLPSMQLRDFSRDSVGPATVVCAPFALHRATVADFSSGHSLVETLLDAGLRHLFVTDWRSATAEMRNFSIDTYLAELNVAVDDVKPPVNLVGLCQGGWLALAYAARFPEKVNRLVLAGAPVDIAAAPSGLGQFVAGTPFAWFEHLVRAGEGRVNGRHLLETWSPSPSAAEIKQVLQFPAAIAPHRVDELEHRFRHWYVSTVDLPGAFYLQVVRSLFKDNQIAENRFVALGRRIDLRDVKIPTCLLAGRDDELVAPEQLLAIRHLIGTSPAEIVTFVENCQHLSLFMGATTLTTTWRRIAGWLAQDTAARTRVA